MALFGKRSSIIAHRGASRSCPENTLAAFGTAWSQGAGAIELDVRLTRDGRIVAMHDATTGRTCDRDLNVLETDHAELRGLDAGVRMGRRWAGERIPLLEEVLAGVPRHGRVFIELKCSEKILPELGRVLRRSGLANRQVCLIGFNLELMARTKSGFPELEVCWISRPAKKRRGPLPTAEELVAKALEANLDGLDLHHSHAFTRDFVKRIHEAGLSLYVWTVDGAATAARLHAMGVDGITTNRPKEIGWALDGSPLLQRIGLAFLNPPQPRRRPSTGIWMLPGGRSALLEGTTRRQGGLVQSFSRLRFTPPCPEPQATCPSSSSRDQPRSMPTSASSISSAIPRNWWSSGSIR